MKISELSRRTGVPVATIKYYLRENLLPGGMPVGRLQAEYGDAHVHRLRLIRTLREVGALGIARIRRVIEAIDDEELSRHDLFGVAQRALEAASAPSDPSEERRRALRDVDQLLDQLGWQVRPDARGRRDLAEALAALRGLGREYGADVFRPYADVADRMAAWEVAAIPPSDPPSIAVERMVVGSILFGSVFDALRRLAHEHHSAGRGAI